MNHDITEENVDSVTIFAFVSLFLVLTRLVPLDVIVSTELSKVWFSSVIPNDATMMKIDPVPGSAKLVGCRVNSTQIVEELGCIDHIFSDKTGTLTKNELVFRKFAIAGQSFVGDTTDEIRT